MRCNPALAPALGLALALAAPAQAQDRVQEGLEELRAAHGFPGATVARVGAEGSIQAWSTGWSDPEARVPMDPNSRMLAASIGKSFVAAAVLALQGDGLLHLDDPVSSWLGGRPWFHRLPNHASLTLRHLLTHSGGVPDHVDLPTFRAIFMALGPEDPPPGPEELIALILDSQPLFPAGEGWAYSDTGYLLAGLVIEEASGAPWTEVVQERFLRPLALADTEPSDRRELQRLAVGTTDMGDRSGLSMRTLDARGLMMWPPGIEGAGGGFISTAADLARWGWLLWSGQALPGPYLDAMLAGVPMGADAPGAAYGLGVSIRQGGEFGPIYGHSGWIPGYVSSLRYFPEEGVAIAIQVNSDVGMRGEGGVFARIEGGITAAILGGRE